MTMLPLHVMWLTVVPKYKISKLLPSVYATGISISCSQRVGNIQVLWGAQVGGQQQGARVGFMDDYGCPRAHDDIQGRGRTAHQWPDCLLVLLTLIPECGSMVLLLHCVLCQLLTTVSYHECQTIFCQYSHSRQGLHASCSVAPLGVINKPKNESNPMSEEFSGLSVGQLQLV